MYRAYRYGVEMRDSTVDDLAAKVFTIEDYQEELNEECPIVEVGGYTFLHGDVLAKMDPIGLRCDWLDRIGCMTEEEKMEEFGIEEVKDFTLEYFDGNSGIQMCFHSLDEAMEEAEYKWSRLTAREKQRYTDPCAGACFMVTDADGLVVRDFADEMEVE